MKRKWNLSLLLLLLISISLTGCFQKRKEIKIKIDNYQILLNVKEATNYKLSQNIKDFRSSREDALITEKDFEISFDISDEISYTEYKGDFEKLKKAHSKDTEFKEITYSKTKGFQRYNESYIRYEVYLPIKNDKSNCLIINVYSKENKDEVVKEKYKSEEIKDILNHISIKPIKK